MARTLEDIQSYLLKMDLAYDESASGTVIIIKGMSALNNLVINIAGMLVVFRLKVMEVPQKNREVFFHTLLELNAREMMHSAYGIEGSAIVISGALPLENLDYNEFAALIDDIMLAVSSHQHKLLALAQIA